MKILCQIFRPFLPSVACANLNAYTTDMLEYLQGASGHDWADRYGHASKCMTVVAVCIQSCWEHVQLNTDVNGQQ